MFRVWAFLIAFLLFLGFQGCGVLKEAKPEDSELKLPAKPLPPEEAKAMLKDVGENWWYGQGVGETAVQAGGAIMFPPYLFYLLGNAAIAAGGYEPVHITDALPEEDRKQYNEVYDSVTSVPGELNADAAGRDFITKEKAKENLKKYFKTDTQKNENEGTK